MRTLHAKACLGTGCQLLCYLWITSVPLRSERLGIWPFSAGQPKSVGSFIQKHLPGPPQRCDGWCWGRGHGSPCPGDIQGPASRCVLLRVVPPGEDSASCWDGLGYPGCLLCWPGAHFRGSAGQAPASIPTSAGLELLQAPGGGRVLPRLLPEWPCAWGHHPSQHGTAEPGRRLAL